MVAEGWQKMVVTGLMGLRELIVNYLWLEGFNSKKANAVKVDCYHFFLIYLAVNY